jgi:type II secretory pathway component PulJ
MKTRNRNSQRGAALVIGLILLAIITLLAVVGMNMSNSELASATSEQLRLRAFQAAETGVERGLQNLAAVGTGSMTPIVDPAVAVEGSATNPANGAAQDMYQTTRQYRDWSNFVPNMSATKFNAYHYTVISTGTSARNAVAVHTQGAFILNNAAP